ncbi:MAG: Na+/H+ antiporter NhaA [Acidimicrobiia bacterium]|nr:Na+/H+ antiporter NhaA [Acidimicrobiia bacterium]
MLLVAAVAAMVWANSPWSDAYHQLVEGTRFAVELRPLRITRASPNSSTTAS